MFSDPETLLLLGWMSAEGVWATNAVAGSVAAELPRTGWESRGVMLYASWWVIWPSGCDSRQTKLMSVESLCG